MTFNVNKCFFTTFNNKDVNRSYAINGSDISFKASFRDLGLIVSSPLSFNKHMDRIVVKSYSKLGLINKLFINKSKASTVRLFKAFVRPTIDFSM